MAVACSVAPPSGGPTLAVIENDLPGEGLTTTSVNGTEPWLARVFNPQLMVSPAVVHPFGGLFRTPEELTVMVRVEVAAGAFPPLATVKTTLWVVPSGERVRLVSLTPMSGLGGGGSEGFVVPGWPGGADVGCGGGDDSLGGDGDGAGLGVGVGVGVGASVGEALVGTALPPNGFAAATQAMPPAMSTARIAARSGFRHLSQNVGGGAEGGPFSSSVVTPAGGTVCGTSRSAPEASSASATTAGRTWVSSSKGIASRPKSKRTPSGARRYRTGVAHSLRLVVRIAWRARVTAKSMVWPDIRAVYIAALNAIAASSLISNCIATTAGIPSSTRLAAVPAMGRGR